MGVASNNFRRKIMQNQIVRDLALDLDLIPEQTEQEIIISDKIAKYVKKNKERIEYKPEPINLNNLKKQFKKVFEFQENKELIISKENKPIYDLIARYFAKDTSFNTTKLTENIPSLEKGLLIIGGVGSGKTSMMNTYYRIAYNRMPDKQLWFSKNSCLSIKLEFEELSDEIQRELFNNKYNNTLKMYFDDFGAESDASNFGKRNLIKEILEERYSRKKITYLSTNLSLVEIKQRYGFRIFDRLQEMFNIIIMNVNSFRK